MAGATDGAREGRNLCIDLIQEIRAVPGVSGIHLMAYRQEESVAEIIDRSGVLAGRVPWYPGRDRAASEGIPSVGDRAASEEIPSGGDPETNSNRKVS
jgi:hypothetical protein